MKISPVTKQQWVKVLKAAAFVGFSAVLDFLISETSGTQFGTLTPVINVVLVLVKQVFSEK